MENSGKILFGSDAPQWYVAVGERWVGPLSASDIYDRIQRQELSWAHYVWKQGQTEWKRICDTKTFQVAVPHQPKKTVQKEIIKETHVKPALKSGTQQAAERAGRMNAAATGQAARAASPSGTSSADARIWYLYYHESQYGPFSREVIRRLLKVGKIHVKVHAWCQGMSNWERLEKLKALVGDAEAPRLQAPSKKIADAEQRSNPRRPLVAKILMADDQSVIVGVCRDISIGGLQVLTERIPGNVGSKLKMNISPASNDLGNRIEPFVAEGVIVRVLEDGRGFSFRFKQLSERAQQAIESYIESGA